MQLPLTDRGYWPWWLAMVLALALAALWWEPAPAARIANRLPGSDGGRPLGATPVRAAAPMPMPMPAPASTSPRSPPLQLVGTVMAGAGSMAMVRLTGGSQLLELRVGDRVQGFAVTAIEPDRVVLAGSAQPIVIEANRIEGDGTVAGAEPPAPSRAISPPPASQVAPPAWAEGDAPWDLVPPFRH